MTLQIKQLDLFPSTLQAKQLQMGQTFLFLNTVHMRTKPVSWMLNSSLIQDKITKGFIFATNLETGKFCTIDGAYLVEPVTGTLSWSK